jgi:hypothetical protein
MMKIIESDPVIGPRFSGASMKGEIKGCYLPLFTRKGNIGERFMLCGDAASLVNPANRCGSDRPCNREDMPDGMHSNVLRNMISQRIS